MTKYVWALVFLTIKDSQKHLRDLTRGLFIKDVRLSCMRTRRLFWLATHQITLLSSSLTLPSATASLTAKPATMARRDMKSVSVPAARQNAAHQEKKN